MANDYYDPTFDFTPYTKVQSAQVDSELAGVAAGFAKLPSQVRMDSGNTNYVEAAGAANAITVTMPTTWTSYTGKGGSRISLKIATNNTGSVTINVDGLGVKTIFRNDGTSLQSGDLVAGGIYDLVYNETAGNFRINAYQGIVTDSTAQATAAAASATAAASSASSASTSATTATNYATKTDGYASGTDNSSKSWAVGGTGDGDPAAGSAKDWASKAEDSLVDGSEYSSKHYAAKSASSASLVSPTFDNVADMVASTAITIGQKVRTVGYYAPGDGGGNDYEIVAAGTGTDDGGSYIDLTGISGQARGLFPSGIYAAQFGASVTLESNEVGINAAHKYAYTLTSASSLFNGGLSRGFTGVDYGGKVYKIKSPIRVVDPTDTGSGGAGGHAVARNGGIVAETGWSGSELIKLTAVNSFDWTQNNALENFFVDCNRLVDYGVRAQKCVGIKVHNCAITRYLSRGVFTDTTTFNFTVSKCYVEAFPFGTGVSESDNRANAPDYGVYFGNSDNVIEDSTVITGNIYAANVPAKTRILGNHFYGNKYSLKYDDQFSLIHGNYIEDPVISVGLVDCSLMGNFFSESNKGASILVADDGSGNGRGSSVIGSTVSNVTWVTTGDITLSATTGTITVTSTQSDFHDWVTTGHVPDGAIITAGAGLAIVTSGISATQVNAQVINDFSGTSFTDTNWNIERSFIAVTGANPNLATSSFVLLGSTGNNPIASGQEYTNITIGSIDAVKTVTDVLATPRSPATATIAAGVISATGVSYLRIDTEASAATDDVDTINGGIDGQRLLVRAVSIARTVVLKNGTGNIICGSDITLDNSADNAEIQYDSSLAKWFLISFSNNGA